MTDFSARFAELLKTLDDEDAEFFGAGMRDELLALVPDLPDRAAEARLFRELAVLEAKRDEIVCLDHAERALAAHADTGALSDDRLYFMHLSCGDVGTAWDGGLRTALHLEQALRLHEKLGRPLAEAFALRLNRGIHERTNGTARMGLDWFEPLLADGEREYGVDSPYLNHLLGLMSDSEAKLGNMKGALAHAERALALLDVGGDPGRRVSALTAHAKLQLQAGNEALARQFSDEAITFADAHCSRATREFAREEKSAIFPAS